MGRGARRRRFAALMALALAVATGAEAQSLAGLTPGQPLPAGFAAPDGVQRETGFTYRRWSRPGGSELSATTQGETGPVLYIEEWRAGPPGAAPLPGLVLGDTTLAEITVRFGSDGLIFSERGRVQPFGEVAAVFTSYEIAGTDMVLSLVTVMPLADAAPETLGASVLDSVVLAFGPYLDSIWGVNRGRLPGYAPIPDPSVP